MMRYQLSTEQVFLFVPGPGFCIFFSMIRPFYLALSLIIAKGATAVAGFEKTSGAAERSYHSAGVRQVPGNDKI